MNVFPEILCGELYCPSRVYDTLVFFDFDDSCRSAKYSFSLKTLWQRKKFDAQADNRGVFRLKQIWNSSIHYKNTVGWKKSKWNNRTESVYINYASVLYDVPGVFLQWNLDWHQTVVWMEDLAYSVCLDSDQTHGSHISSPAVRRGWKK